MKSFYFVFCLYFKFRIPDKYFQKKIENLPIKCIAYKDCEWQGSLLEYKDHYNTHFRITPLMECKYCSKKLESQTEVSAHLGTFNGTCMQQPVNCMFKPIGCSFKDIERKFLKDHVSQDAQKHLELMHTHFESEITRLSNINLGIAPMELEELCELNTDTHFSSTILLIHVFT